MNWTYIPVVRTLYMSSGVLRKLYHRSSRSAYALSFIPLTDSNRRLSHLAFCNRLVLGDSDYASCLHAEVVFTLVTLPCGRMLVVYIFAHLVPGAWLNTLSRQSASLDVDRTSGIDKKTNSLAYY